MRFSIQTMNTLQIVLLQSMFDTAHELGSLLSIRNRMSLTPLTLAAKLARRDMFFHILKIEREIYWQIGMREEACGVTISKIAYSRRKRDMRRLFLTTARYH